MTPAPRNFPVRGAWASCAGSPILLAWVLLQTAPAAPFPAAQIEAAARYSRQSGGQALIIRQDGRLLHESYAPGVGANQPCPVMSITKSLAALALLAAQADRLLTLDEPVGRTIPEWRGARARITIRQLLNQTSGLATGYEAIYARGVRDKNQAALALTSLAAPGSRFAYAPGNYELLEEILQRKLAGRPTDPLRYLVAKVFAPLGLQPSDWRRDRQGHPFFSAGAALTARDLAGIGELVRRRGRLWIRPLLPAEALTGSAANSMYGLGFWLNANAARAGAEPISVEGTLTELRSPAAWRRACLSPAAPPDLVALIGSGGQRCYVAPSRGLVVVRFGKGPNFDDDEFLRRLFGR